MKIRCEKHILQAVCAICSRAAASKSPIPALEGLLISAQENTRITGYDLKKGIYTNIESEIEESGSIVVGARLFGEMIRRMPDGVITISSDQSNNVNVKCGKSEFNFIGISSEDYPEIPQVEADSFIELPQNVLKTMINQTIFAVADNDVRPIYTGTLFEIKDNSITLVSVDGYRLAKRTETLDSASLHDCSFIVPGSTLSDIERICADEDKPVRLSLGEKHISFEIGDTVIISRRLEGEFLNYRKSIPTEFKYKIGIDKTELLSAIDRVSLIINEKNSSPVRMTFNDGAIDCLCLTALGRAQDICTCDGNGDGLLIGFNDRYVTEALKACGKEELQLCINTASSPCIITAADASENFTYMILPVRLRAGD